MVRKKNKTKQNKIWIWLDFLVFSDKDDKPQAPAISQALAHVINLWDVKEPAHSS